MKGKLSEIFKQIAKYERKPPSPERIASEFMEWKKKRLGLEVYYFVNHTRNKSKSWKYFERLSSMLAEWGKRDIKVDLWTYFDSHLRKVGRNKNLYPNQLVLKYSHEIMLGRGTVDPILVETVNCSSDDSEDKLLIDVTIDHFTMKLVDTTPSNWEGMFDK